MELGKAQAKINALKTRAEKAEALLREAQDGLAEARRLGIEATQRAEKAELDLYRAIPVYEEALKLARERAEKAEAALIAADKEIVELEAEAVALKADLARAVEERDAALVLYKAILPSALSWCQRVPQVPVREAVAARELLRERGLLVGER